MKGSELLYFQKDKIQNKKNVMQLKANAKIGTYLYLSTIISQ